MLVVGLDPGSLRFGVGLLRKEKKAIAFVHAETIRLKPGDFTERMRQLWERLQEIYREFPPAAAAMEEGFLGENVRAMSQLALARGVALASLVDRRLPVRFYTPREVKLALTGYGNASKEQVARMVGLLLRLPDKNKMGTDESDALAVAYCHAARLP